LRYVETEEHFTASDLVQYMDIINVKQGIVMIKLALITLQLFLLASLSLSTPSMASNSINPGDIAKQGKSISAITPVFSQLIMFSYPAGFKLAFQERRSDSYLQEHVPEKESVDKWTQIVTLTGTKDLAKNPAITPQQIMETLASGYQKSCPSTFSTEAFGQFKISGHDTFAALIGCGTVLNGPPRSEVAMILAIKGVADYYTIQWAERAPALAQRPTLDGEKWFERLKLLNPIKICNRTQNEQAPYPSCINQK
jgi:hypothetical protein